MHHTKSSKKILYGALSFELTCENNWRHKYPRPCQNSQKVSSLFKISYQMSIDLTFGNIWRHKYPRPRQNSQKVRFLFKVSYQMSIDLTFGNIWQHEYPWPCQTSPKISQMFVQVSSWLSVQYKKIIELPWSWLAQVSAAKSPKFSKNQLSFQCIIQNDHRSDFREILKRIYKYTVVSQWLSAEIRKIRRVTIFAISHDCRADFWEISKSIYKYTWPSHGLRAQPHVVGVPRMRRNRVSRCVEMCCRVF